MAYDTTKLVKLAALKALAEKVKADYAKQADLTALKEQVQGLVTAGGEPNVLEGVKVNGTALDIADKMVNILIGTGANNGSISVNGVSIMVKGLAALAYKAQVSESDLDTALKAVLDAKASGADVTTLIGSDTGKSVRTIANEELAAQLIPEGAKDSLNTLQEIADWIQEHPDDASAMNTAITKLQAIVAGIGGEEDDYATVTAALEGKIAEALTGISEGATKVEESETNGNIKIDGVETTVYTHPAKSPASAAFVKVGNDAQGHVVLGGAVTKADITALGIPAQDTTYSPAVANGANGLMTGTDKAKLDGMIVAEDTEVTEMLNEVFAD